MPIVIGIVALVLIVVGVVYVNRAEPTPGTEPEVVVEETVSPTTTAQPTGATAQQPATPPASTPTAPPPTPAPVVAASQSLTVHMPYRSPAKIQESITVNLVVKDGVVTAVDSSYNEGQGQNPFQERFDDSYKTLVVGKKLSDISLSRVGGASLTSQAFNAVVAEAIVKTQS